MNIKGFYQINQEHLDGSSQSDLPKAPDLEMWKR